MLIWKCECYDDSEGTVLSWHPNKRAAEKDLALFQRERGKPASGPESISPVEIPTDKLGLIDWLNDNFTRDNG